MSSVENNLNMGAAATPPAATKPPAGNNSRWTVMVPGYSRLAAFLWPPTPPAATTATTAPAASAGVSAVGRVAVVPRRRPPADPLASSITCLDKDGTYVNAQRVVFGGDGEANPKGPAERIFLPVAVSGIDVGVYPSQANTAEEYDRMLGQFKKRSEVLGATLISDLLKSAVYCKTGQKRISVPNGKGEAIEVVIPPIVETDLDRQTIEIDGVVMKKEGNSEELRKRNCYSNCHTALGNTVTFTNNVMRLCTQGALFDAFKQLKLWFSSDDYPRDIVQPKTFHFKVYTKEALEKENSERSRPLIRIVCESLYPVKNSLTEKVLKDIKVVVTMEVPLESLQRDVDVGAGGTYSMTAELA